jgi:hypothetical protein
LTRFSRPERERTLEVNMRRYAWFNDVRHAVVPALALATVLGCGTSGTTALSGAGGGGAGGADVGGQGGFGELGAGGFGGFDFGTGGSGGATSGSGGAGGGAMSADAGSPPPPPPEPTCGPTAHTGDYCTGDKIENGAPDTLYHCVGPGPVTKHTTCANGCVIAPAGQDDYCDIGLADCAHHSLLKWGLCPNASDHLRCSGITASKISQTIGNAPASAGTHAQDGTIGGAPYCAATDLSVSSLTDAQVKPLLEVLTSNGFAPFFRRPGHDGWPSYDARHIHAIYVGVKMKAALRAQVADWLAGKNGLTSHTTYTFWQASAAKKAMIKALFKQYN